VIGGPSCASRRSNSSEPATRSGIGSFSRRAIQTSGMPSARHRSLPMTDSRNSASVCAEITKLRLGVAITQRVFERAACRTFSTAVCMSIASIGRPAMQ
jgi:hypothetical protein